MKDFLEKIGLSEKEALVYLYLLKVENDSVADIAKHTKINRTTIYPVLQQLIHKEFVEEVQENGKAIYRARTPDRIESYLQEQKIKIEEQTHEAKDIIPQMKGVMRQDGQRPLIEYYDGREAILQSSKNFFADIKKDDEVYMIYPRDEVENLFTDKERKLLKDLRVNKEVRSKSIYTYTKGNYNPDNTGDRFHIDKHLFPVSSDISVYGDKVRMHTLGEKLGTISIINKEIAETLRTLFKLAIKGLNK